MEFSRYVSLGEWGVCSSGVLMGCSCFHRDEPDQVLFQPVVVILSLHRICKSSKMGIMISKFWIRNLPQALLIEASGFPVIRKDKMRGEGSSREVVIYPKEKEHTARPSPALSSSFESLNKQIYSLTEFELR